MRVAILPTGRTEWRGLAPAFTRLFPRHEFYCLPSAVEIQSNPAGFPYPGFTSVALTERDVASPPERARELVERAVQEALGDRSRLAADLVIIIDDVELPNQDRPDLVVDVMRHAVIQHLQSLSGRSHDKTSRALRDRVSFHLIAPMIESWFFADPGALRAAGVAGDTPVHFQETTDPEAFVTDDPDYLSATPAACPALSRLPSSKQKKHHPKWLGALPRARHPKGYLQWLCRDPEDRTCTRYAEISGGGDALAGIVWPCLLGRSESHFGFLRALVQDLADGLHETLLPEGASGVVAPQTDRACAPRTAVLRNL